MQPNTVPERLVKSNPRVTQTECRRNQKLGGGAMHHRQNIYGTVPPV